MPPAATATHPQTDRVIRSFTAMIGYEHLAEQLHLVYYSSKNASLQNMPYLIAVYQWGAIVYSGCVVLLFVILAAFCFFVHTNCALAGGLLIALIVVNILGEFF